jgi:hypothetical protein
MDGLNLSASVAKDDPSPEVKCVVANALAYRSADRHLAEILRAANDNTFDLIAREGQIDEVTDERVRACLNAARERQRGKGISTYDQLHAIVYAQDGEDHSGELTARREIDQHKSAFGHAQLFVFRARLLTDGRRHHGPRESLGRRILRFSRRACASKIKRLPLTDR